MDNGIGTIIGKDEVFVGRPVNGLSVILPEMSKSTKLLIAEFVRQISLPKEVRVKFEEVPPDIDGNPQTKLKARWRT